MTAAAIAAAADNGILYVETHQSTSATIRAYDLHADGSASNGRLVSSAAPPPASGPAMVVGRGRGLVMTGRSAGGVAGATRYCAMLRGNRFARTSTVGVGVARGRVMFSSLATGSRLGSVGPITGLTRMGGVPSGRAVVIARTARAQYPSAGRVVLERLSATTGRRAAITAVPTLGGARAVCALKGSGALVSTAYPRFVSMRVVGARPSRPLAVAAARLPFGCSADGRFAYAVRDEGNGRAAIVAVRLSDGVVRPTVTGSADLLDRLTVTP